MGGPRYLSNVDGVYSSEVAFTSELPSASEFYLRLLPSALIFVRPSAYAMYFNGADPSDATIVAPNTASVTSVTKDVAFLDAECVMELRAYIAEGNKLILPNKPIISPTLTPPQTPISSHPPPLVRARRPPLSPVPDTEAPITKPRRAYRTPMETRRRLGWIVDDPRPKRRLTPMNRASRSVRTVRSSSSSSPQDLGDMLAMLSILMLINFLGPCCFVYAGLRVVFMALSRRSSV